MIGSWRDEWDAVRTLQHRLETIYTGRGDGSTDARADLIAFFERTEGLRDWVTLELDEPKRTGRIDQAMRDSLPLSLAHDVAIKTKHGRQDEEPWAGRVGGTIVSQSATVRPATIGSASEAMGAHSWRIRYTPRPTDGDADPPEVDIDALRLSRDVVEAWRLVLVDVGLLPE